MTDFKYIVIRVNDTYDYPFFFPNKVCHDDMADAARHAIVVSIQGDGGKQWETKIVSAGFISIEDMVVTKHGSETLGIISNKDRAVEDQRMFNTFNYNHGIVGV